MTRPLLRCYLAGPDVFLPDPEARGARLKEICARHDIAGVFPLDPLQDDEPEAWAALPPAGRIALRNEAHIRGCDALVANLTPFRGPSADAGTVFELGFMRALGRPVSGWTNVAADFTARTLAHVGIAKAKTVGRDADGMAVEAFGCVDNLMLDGAILASGGCLVVANIAPAARWSDLGAFEACIARLAAVLPRPVAVAGPAPP